MMNYLIIFLISIAGAIITWELNVKYKFGGVKASSVVSLIAGLIIYFQKIDPIYGVAIMGASFAAMSSDKVIPTRVWMFICSLVFSIIFINLSNNFFAGFGGKLGTTACMSVVFTLGLMKITGRYKKYSKLLHC